MLSLIATSAFSDDVASRVQSATMTYTPSGAKGTVWIKQDCTVPDGAKAGFGHLISGEDYKLVSQTDAGAFIICQDADGQKRLALVPFRDGMGNPSGRVVGESFRASAGIGVVPTPVFYTLKAGSTYSVVKEENGGFGLLYYEHGLTVSLTVPTSCVSFISKQQMLNIVTNLAAQAVIPARAEDLPAVQAVFENYNGQYAQETASVRATLAIAVVNAVRDYHSELEEQRTRQENIAKGLVQDGREWITKEEKVRREKERVEYAKAEAERREKQAKLEAERREQYAKAEAERLKAQAEMQARQQAEQQRRINECYRLRSDEEAAREWNAIRSAPDSWKGAVTTWKLVVESTNLARLMNELPLTKTPPQNILVHARLPEGRNVWFYVHIVTLVEELKLLRDGDSIVLTGKIDEVGLSGDIWFTCIRVTKLAYGSK